ncbi:RES family NAD+ phosphorylase [Pseudoduganella chitinolytica]|uniref:RES family NAD+ phosphorylase n=1 Tax=Pseudoduganella chitinolytica TaxID=34070 RepID=A0ABY8BBP1_9BURK|nr:RES family NAD+ phosphorylase [Pseudoduganella chitinolytica]WEF33320.1 RES family NAD+ phosphorylase [Pseudoduganella chitinolytica]
MTRQLWRIAAVTQDHAADDLSGQGAKATGGRWNARGTAVVYTSANIALASLETLAHLELQGLPLNRYLVRIDVPDDVDDARTILAVPPGWDAQPYGLPSVQAGTAWCRANATALLEVPSVLVPEEVNVLINPRHPDSARLRATVLRKWLADPRVHVSRG